MKDVVDHLWPKRPKPNSYFSLVQQFLDVVPRINAMKRSACIEGTWMAFARVKAYHHCSVGFGHRSKAAEHYFEEVLEGARLIETQCSKNIMFE